MCSWVEQGVVPVATMPERRHWTEAEYLVVERQATTKHEYRQGEIIAMVGASPAHNQITASIIGQLYMQLRGSPCQPLGSDMRVRVSSAGLYAYPDVIVVCGELQVADAYQDMLLNPTLIIEVLSPSTEQYDRTDKFTAYKALDSMREYLLVSQHEARIEQWVRQDGGLWTRHEVSGLAATLRLVSVDAALPLSEVYARVTLDG